MKIIDQVHEKFLELCREKNVELNQPVQVKTLSSDEAIGCLADTTLALKKGQEVMVEAEFNGSRGQAFTSTPASFQGTLHDVTNLDLSNLENVSIFLASINAVMRSLFCAEATIHCHDCAPLDCGVEMARQLKEQFGIVKYGIVGLQPSILEGMVREMGAENVRIVDLNPDNIGITKSGIPVWNGETDLPWIVDWCTVGLVTGSSAANGTIDRIAQLFKEANKPVVYFGTTIAGVAALLGLKRICPFGE